MSGRDYLLRVVVEGVDRASSALKNVRRHVVETSKEVEKASTSFMEFSSSLRRIGEIAGGVIAGLIGFNILDRVNDLIRDGVRAFAEFEAESIKLASLSREAGQDINLLAQSFRIAASAASRDYAISAEQAMAALQSLIKAGLSGGDAMNALGAAIQMARLESIDFATAGNNLVQVMAQFGLSGSEATRVVDALVNASRLGIGTANDFAQGLANCGATARAMGLGLEDATTWLIILERRFGSAQEAGTHLNRFLLDLYEIAEKLGIPIRDMSGSLRAANEVIKDVISRAKELGGDFEDLRDRLTGVDMRALKTLFTFTQMTERFEELRKEVARQGSTWEAYQHWLETTQGRFAAMSAEVDRMKRRIGESASSIAVYLGNMFLPAVETVFASWRGIVAAAVGDVAGNLESAIEVQMRLGRVTEEQAGAWIMSYVEMGKITEQEALRIAEHLGIMTNEIQELINRVTAAGGQVPSTFQNMADSAQIMGDALTNAINRIQDALTDGIISSQEMENIIRAMPSDVQNLAQEFMNLQITIQQNSQALMELKNQIDSINISMMENQLQIMKIRDAAADRMDLVYEEILKLRDEAKSIYENIQAISEERSIRQQEISILQNIISTRERMANVQERITSLQEKLTKAHGDERIEIQEKMADLQNEYVLLQQRLAAYEQQYQMMVKILEQYGLEPVALDQTIEALQNELAARQSYLTILQQQIWNLQQEYEQYQKSIQAKQRYGELTVEEQLKIRELESANRDLRIRQMELQQQYKSLQIEVDTAKNRLQEIMNVIRQKISLINENVKAVNRLIEALNKLNGMKITYEVTEVRRTIHTREGGAGIPEHQHGAWNVRRTHIALIHKGEAILPKWFAEPFRRWIGERAFSPQIINVHVNVNTSDISDPTTLAEVVGREIARRLRRVM